MHEQSISLLNEAIADELTAIHQYMFFHFHCDDQGLDLLANLFRKTAIEEMMHVERLAERILFLKGDVVLDPPITVARVTDPNGMIEFGTKLEEATSMLYNKFATQCAAHSDSVSKKLFEDLVIDEERHFDQFDTESDHLKDYGNNYLALQSIERSKKTSSGPAGATDNTA